MGQIRKRSDVVTITQSYGARSTMGQPLSDHLSLAVEIPHRVKQRLGLDEPPLAPKIKTAQTMRYRWALQSGNVGPDRGRNLHESLFGATLDLFHDRVTMDDLARKNFLGARFCAYDKIQLGGVRYETGSFI
jgi:hypothetical protein